MTITKLEPGKRYRVTAVIEGVADEDGEIRATPYNEAWSSATNYRTGPCVRVGAEATTVEEIEPTYLVGRFYRDADGDLVMRRSNRDEPWLHIYADGTGEDTWFETTPRRPLVALELKEITE